jgi:hypothetical protein
VDILQRRHAEKLAATAATYGIALADGASERLADHFEAKRNAVLSYNR